MLHFGEVLLLYGHYCYYLLHTAIIIMMVLVVMCSFLALNILVYKTINMSIVIYRDSRRRQRRKHKTVPRVHWEEGKFFIWRVYVVATVVTATANIIEKFRLLHTFSQWICPRIFTSWYTFYFFFKVKGRTSEEYLLFGKQRDRLHTCLRPHAVAVAKCRQTWNRRWNRVKPKSLYYTTSLQFLCTTLLQTVLEKEGMEGERKYAKIFRMKLFPQCVNISFWRCSPSYIQMLNTVVKHHNVHSNPCK